MSNMYSRILLSCLLLSPALSVAESSTQSLAKIAKDSLDYMQQQNYKTSTFSAPMANYGDQLIQAYDSANNQQSAQMINTVTQLLGGNTDNGILSSNPKTYYSSLMGSDVPSICRATFSKLGKTPGLASNIANYNYDVNSLIGTTVLDKDQQPLARNYLAFLTNLVDPYVPKKLSAKDQDDCQAILSQNTDDILKQRNWVSVNSLALSTIYHSYTERLPNPKLKKALNLKGDVSALSAEKYLAERRLQPDYQAAIEQMPPATVAREQLRVLSQISYQLYQQQRATERHNLLLSAQLLQLANSDIAKKMMSMSTSQNK